MAIARKWRLRFTTDREGNNQLNEINFGTVEEGNRRTLTVYMTNLEDYRVEGITYTKEKEDLIVTQCPVSLESMEVAELRLSWGVFEDTLSLKDVIKFSGTAIKEISQ